MMKQIILIFNLFSLLTLQAKDSISVKPTNFPIQSLRWLEEDCDACGCAVGNAASGFESILNPQFIGIKYLYQSYESKSNILDAHFSVPEYYNTVQIWGRIPLHKNVDVYVNLPFHFHSRYTADTKQELSGVGDASASVIYKFNLDKQDSHRLNFGVGVKVPLAKFDEKTANTYNPSFQRGTGSWDYSAIVNYTYMKGQWAVALSTDYIFKNQNKYYYRFGDQWNTSVTGYYIKDFDGFRLSPRLGISTEKYFQNVQVGEKVPHTGGYLVLSKLGAEFSFRKFNIGLESQLPLRSEIAVNSVRINARHSVYINFNL
ncbi:hypothetical protein JSO59_004510 [Riemerella anatipestifer]|uniref:hypothetical protein n=1 Tax=Riemerella anatipestifer TaxID=34085 RepID=UPI0030BDBE2F